MKKLLIIFISTLMPLLFVVSPTLAYGPLVLPFYDQEYDISQEWSESHTGVDYDTPNDPTPPVPVMASADGTVTEWADGWDNDPGCYCYGNYVKIDHGDDLLTLYAHLKKYTLTDTVKDYSSVKQGQVIAKENNSGNSTGDHVHFESRVSGVSVDPYAEPATSTVFLWTTDPPSLANYATTTISSNISSTTVWTDDYIYLINGAIAVNSGVTLTIEPGVIVKFKTTTSKLTVNGTLDVQGEEGSEVYFTSFKDDSVGGDTNGDGSYTSPHPFDWDGIDTSATGSTTLSHAVVQYGSKYSGVRANVKNSGGILNVFDSEIAHTATTSASFGIYITSGTTTIDSTLIYDNYIGLYQTGGVVIMTWSEVYDDSVGGVAATAGKLDINSTIFTNNGTDATIHYAGSIDAAVDFYPSNNSADGTGANGFYRYNNVDNGDRTWPADNIPYIIYLVTVNSGYTLTLEPDAVVKFKTTTSKLTVNGTLDVQGEEGSEVYFTSFKDDSVGGDTNDDDDSTTPGAGNWIGIDTSATGSTTMSHAVVRYGGCTSSGNLKNSGGILNVFNSEIATSSYYGFFITSGTTTIDSTTIHNNSSFGLYQTTSGLVNITWSEIYDNNYGICTINTNSGGDISNNSIHDNNLYGAYKSSSPDIDLEYNYWGAASGPTHAGNPGGTGDTVSNNIDYANYLSIWP